MYLDSSAIITVLLKKPGWKDVTRRIEDHRGNLITAASSCFEAVTTIAGPQATPATLIETRDIVRAFLKEAGVREVPISEAQTKAALDAYAEALETRPNAPLDMGEALVLGVARTFKTDVLFTGDRFPCQ